MTIQVIITICILLLLAYLFDITSSKTKVPSVILLLALGCTVGHGASYFKIPIPDLNPTLPVLGTLGLILIVLEGSLELEINKSKLRTVGVTSFLAFLPIMLLSFSVAFAFQYYQNTTYKIALANAIPFAVISSAIAIPSVRNLTSKNKEFVIYESSLSDIFGVIFFNFITRNAIIGFDTFQNFFIELLIILFISFVSTIVLALLLSKINHHVKFVPIILMIVLIYTTTKNYHLPALLFILLFGILIGNIDELKNNKYIDRLKPEILKKEVIRFKELTAEIAFLIRSLFFLLFGYLIDLKELLNLDTLIWSSGISIGIIIFRYVCLKMVKVSAMPLLFIAPRGLITILLYLSIPVNQTMKLVNDSMIIQVILITALFMMLGLMTNKTKKEIIA